RAARRHAGPLYRAAPDHDTRTFSRQRGRQCAGRHGRALGWRFGLRRAAGPSAFRSAQSDVRAPRRSLGPTSAATYFPGADSDRESSRSFVSSRYFWKPARPAATLGSLISPTTAAWPSTWKLVCIAIGPSYIKASLVSFRQSLVSRRSKSIPALRFSLSR